MTPDEMEALRMLIHAEMQAESEERPHGRFRLVHLAIIGATFGVGVLLHFCIESTGLKAVLQPLELSLGSAYAVCWDRIREGITRG